MNILQKQTQLSRIILSSSLLWVVAAYCFTFALNVQGKALLGPALIILIALMVVSSRVSAFFQSTVTRNLSLVSSLLVLAGCTSLGILFYYNFSNHDSGDIAYYLSAFRNMHLGLPWYHLFSKYPFLANHSEFLCIPLAWLFHLVPEPWFLLFLQSIMVTAAWFLLRRWLYKTIADAATAEFLSFAFACSPVCVVPLLMGFHGVSTALPVLVLTATSFHDRRWKQFVISLSILLLAKEIFAVTAISLGIFALVIRRPPRWYILPLVAGILYGVFLKYYYFPMMLGDSTYFYTLFYKGPAQAVVALFSLRGIDYVFFLLLIGGSAAVLRTPYVLLAIPSVALAFMLDERFTLKHLHYVIEPAFWSFFAGVVAFTGNKETGRLKIIRPVALCATMLLLTAFQRHGLPLYAHHPYAASYKKALSLIPENASVALGAPLADHLWKAKRAKWVIYTRDSCYDMDWAILQKAGNPAWCMPAEFAAVREFYGKMKSTGFELVWEDSIMAVFKKSS